MKKIPTLFVRDMTAQPALVVDAVTPGCEWVLEGEGYPTRKFDGTCCLIRDGLFYGRREVKPGANPPGQFELVDQDETTGKSFGWVPIDESPNWKWHQVAKRNAEIAMRDPLADGTYEACGPHFQNNPERLPKDILIPHGREVAVITMKRTYDSLKEALIALGWEGIVWYHPDGRRAKLKLKDYGLQRK